MLNLKQFRDRAKGTADLLNYAALVDDGLVLCKDGSLLGGFLYRGPDTASATPSELNYTTGRINAALARLGTGYALWSIPSGFRRLATLSRMPRIFPIPSPRRSRRNAARSS